MRERIHVSPYFAKMVIGASASFKFRIRLPWSPCQISKIEVSTSQDIEFAGDLFNSLKIQDQLESSSGEHKKQVNFNGSVSMGGVAGTEMKFMDDIVISGKNLDASTANLLIQFLVIAKES